MSESCNRAILDTLLPGEGDLPAATAAEFDIETHAPLLAPIAAASSRIAGNEEAFVGADETRRAEIQVVLRDLDVTGLAAAGGH